MSPVIDREQLFRFTSVTYYTWDYYHRDDESAHKGKNIEILNISLFNLIKH